MYTVDFVKNCEFYLNNKDFYKIKQMQTQH